MKGPERNACLRVGLTGGIGSGKSLVCRLFTALGIPIYDADARAKALAVEDATLRQQIVDLLGPQAYEAQGAYNRAWVAQQVFGNPALLAQLNALIHPRVEEDSQRWHAMQCAQGVPYTIKEAALMIESGAWKHLDALVVVEAPEALRLSRVLSRDYVHEEAVRQRMRNQLTDDQRRAYAQHIVVNDGQRMLIPQVWRIHRALLDRSAAQTVPGA